MRFPSPLKLTLYISDSECTESDVSAPFCDALVTTRQSLQHRYFFPGHGGMNFPKFVEEVGSNSFFYDLPELDGLDNIHFPEGPLKASLSLASQLYDAKETWYLLNGSSGGLLVAILSCFKIHQIRKQILQKVMKK
eukprot:gene34763-46684_t